MKPTYFSCFLLLLTLWASTSNGAEWGPFVDDGCLTCGQKIWASHLMNINGDWEEACWATPARPPGTTQGMLPYRCQNRGIGGMWGFFNVTVPWGSCDYGSTGGAPFWGTFRDDGCITGGLRVFASRLWEIQGDWMDACQSTQGRPRGEGCILPDICEDGGVISGMWGKFRIPDPTCNIVF